MATIFMVPGATATQDLTLFNLPALVGTGASIAYDTQAVKSSNGSIKASSGASNSFAAIGQAASLADTGRRITFYFRYHGTISPSASGGADFVTIETVADAAVFGVSLDSSGHIVITGDGSSALATGSSVLSADTDYRICVVYTITSTTVNTITVYLNSASEVTATNVTLPNSSSDTLFFGWGAYNGAGANMIGYFAHIYMDDGTSGDIGDIRLTAKRPFSNGSLNQFATSGTGSGYGSGHAPYVNERPLSTTSLVTVTPTTAQVEEYTIEGASVGDNNITGVTIVDYMGWMRSEVASTANSPVMKIILNNVATTKTHSTSYRTYTVFAGTTTYPGGNTDIGMSAQYTTTGHLVSLAECGVVFAYTPAAVVNTGNFFPFLRP